MTGNKGFWTIAALAAAYAALYWHHVLPAAMPPFAKVSFFLASCSVICMTAGMMLAARPRFLETWFGGLDKMYQSHKVLGVAALLLFIAHYATVPRGHEGPPGAAGEQGGPPIDLVGLIAMIGFTLLVILSLNRKVPYHRWLPTHRFMGLLFAVVSVHVFMVLYDREQLPFRSAPGVALTLLLTTGLAAFAYRQFLEVNRLERATELVLRPENGMFAFEPGQFAFVTVDADGFREAHPFTISSGAGEDGLRFTMKVLGDYTRRVLDNLAAGAAVTVEGPYGCFNPLRGAERQVWVAGGIGITPFLSVMRSLAPGHGKTVRLYYCVRTAREALFLDELEARAAEVGGVTLTLLASDAGAPRISGQRLAADLGGAPTHWSYYLCGPKPMVAAIVAGLKGQGVPKRRIHREEFEFR